MISCKIYFCFFIFFVSNLFILGCFVFTSIRMLNNWFDTHYARKPSRAKISGWWRCVRCQKDFLILEESDLPDVSAHACVNALRAEKNSL